jgi:hypothetical protein
MIFVRKLKEARVVNTVEALGIIPGVSGEVADEDPIVSLWGGDPCPPQAGSLRTPS